jgi:hypothetical protein
MIEWSSEKTQLNELVARLNKLMDQLPSVHNDSVPVGSLAEIATANLAIGRAIHALEPLRKYKNPLPNKRSEQ